MRAHPEDKSDISSSYISGVQSKMFARLMPEPAVRGTAANSGEFLSVMK